MAHRTAWSAPRVSRTSTSWCSRALRGGRPGWVGVVAITSDRAGISMNASRDTTPLLAVDGVGTGYGDLKVVRGVSLNARSGRVTALVGRNGAGKSALLRAICGLFRRLTVEQNLLLGGSAKRYSRKQARPVIDEILELFPVLAARRSDLAAATGPCRRVQRHLAAARPVLP
ncbi:ATP-binding cassette domain-containing protein [Dactylosporangium roseum]|uniref:ATP-binding cassette domain-containing protein n=2 Tax=Dactylosporangium roseum TaxID=47989 RepID=A0ABY5ZFI0_9ACTN|nr:ATP-binding cassette domain-containing protein [Dactylosporangium roseum]